MGKLLDLIVDNWDLTWTAEPGIGTDKHNEHDYIQGFYDAEFEKYCDKPIDLLEIGIFGGASLALWSKYFPYATLTGVDINNNIDPKYREVERVQHLFSNAYDYKFVNSLGTFDIIIDDGPHSLDSQIQCLRLYLDKLNPGGILVIEDVQDPGWFDYLKENTPKKYMDGVECIDIRENLGRWDDLLYVVRV